MVTAKGLLKKKKVSTPAKSTEQDVQSEDPEPKDKLDSLSQLAQNEPFIAENYLLAYLDIRDLCQLHQVNKACHTYLSPSDEYCPQFANVFEKYTGEVFDESIDWKEQIKNV